MAFTPLLMASGAQHQALLERRLEIGAVARLRLAAQVVGSAASIAAAAAGLGASALVAGQYFELIALAVFAWAVEPWRPARLQLAGGSWGLLRFGGQYTLSQLVFFVAGNLDKVLVGLWFGERALGWYSQAFQVAQKPVLLVTTPVSSVMLPALARAAGDRAAHAALVGSFFRLTAALLWPCGVGLLIVAPEAMLALGGPEWAPAGRLLRALGLTLFVQGFVNLCGSVFAAAGRADRLLGGAAAIALSLTAAYGAAFWLAPRFTSAPLAQLEALAWAHSAALLLVGAPYATWCCRTEGMSLRGLLGLLGPALRAALLMGLLVVCVHTLLLSLAQLSAVALLLLEVSAGALSYLWLARRELAAALALRERANS
jgi:PST family polysaccharide transporter